MSTTYQIASHEVTATVIEDVLPLTRNERIQAPQNGVLLILESGKRLDWIPDAGRIPAAFDVLIEDAIFGNSFIVKPKEFAKLFSGTTVEETNPCMTHPIIRF